MSPVLADLLNIRLIINSRLVLTKREFVYSNIFKLLDVALLQTVTLLLVYYLQEY